MRKEIISDSQAIALLALYIVGDAVVLAVGLEAKKDLWLAIILGAVMAALVYLVYAKILAAFPGKDMFEICGIVFGNVIGRALCILLIWFALHLGALVMRTFGEFINTVGLPETPRLVPQLFITGLCIWGAKEGIEIIGRYSELFIKLLIPLSFFIDLLLIGQMNINNLFPVLYNGPGPVIRGGFSAFTFPFGEAVVAAMVLSSLKNKKSSVKVFMTGLLIAAVMLLIFSTVNILILGAGEAARNYFPTYTSVTRLTIGAFIQRVEGTVAVAFQLIGFVKISICLLAACRGISWLFGFKDYRFLAAPVGLFILGLSCFVYDNMIQMHYWPSRYWPYYAFPFEVILPVIILIGTLIKQRKSKQKA